MLIVADARQIPLQDGVVQCVVTSPPYWGLRDYGLGDRGIGLERTPEEHVQNLVAVFREVWRVLRGDGVVWLNLGDCYCHDRFVNKMDGTFEGIDGLYSRKFHYMDGCSSGGPKRSGGIFKTKDLMGIPWRVAFALQADGWWLRSDIIWSKPNPMPESVRDRPTKSHEYIFLLTKSARYYWDAEAVKEPATNSGKIVKLGDKSLSRGQARGANIVPSGNALKDSVTVAAGRNIRTVWTIPTQPYRGAHFATFPEAIPEKCIKAGSKLGDIVLDPFVGSGTTIAVAEALGRKGIGIDLKYQDLAQERIKGGAKKVKSHPLLTNLDNHSSLE